MNKETELQGQPHGRIFRASSYHSNFPSELEFGDGVIWWRRKTWLGSDELCVKLARIKLVEIKGGLFWSTIILTRTGGLPIISKGHPNGEMMAFREALAEAKRR